MEVVNAAATGHRDVGVEAGGNVAGLKNRCGGAVVFGDDLAD